MFKKHKLEVRIVKDDARTNNTMISDAPQTDPIDYALIAEEAANRLGKKAVVSVILLIATAAVITVLAHAADTALQESITD